MATVVTGIRGRPLAYSNWNRT